MIYVIGANGLVGSAVCRALAADRVPFGGITRDNYAEYAGRDVDCVINANGSGAKTAASQNPPLDFEKNVVSTMKYVFDFKTALFVHISSIDVYQDPASEAATREDSPIDVECLSPYGLHKYLSELIVRKYCPRWLILRLGGLVGPGLAKNPVYDWSHGKPFFISAESALTFIHTDAVAAAARALIDCGVVNEVINVAGADNIRLKDFSKIRDFGTKEVEGPLSTQTYRINVEKLSRVFQPKSSRDYIEQYLAESVEMSRG
jgi:nucleoside-diphosphate-sugar epimerase